MRRLSGLRDSFASLRIRNYRLFFVGQTVSVTGTWMQKIGQAWLVLELAGSGTLLGLTVAIQHLPTLLLAPLTGLLADRMDKRKICSWCAALEGCVAAVLATITLLGIVELWMVFALAITLGMIEAVDKPARQSFAIEMVGRENVMNAVTLASVIQNAGRIGGPSIAGLLIASVGLAASFYVNAVSYVAVLAGLLMMRKDELFQPEPVKRGRGQLREGVRYVRRTPVLLGTIALMTVAGIFAYEFMVSLPLFARDAFGGGAETFGLMFSVMGVGAVLGGVVVAGTMRASPRSYLVMLGVLSVAMVAAAAAPTMPIALGLLFVVGWASVAFRSVGTALVQLVARPQLRGRVMGLVAVTIGGTAPLGAPLVGWIGETFGGRVAVGQGGVVIAIAGVLALLYLRRHEVPISVAMTTTDALDERVVADGAEHNDVSAVVEDQEPSVAHDVSTSDAWSTAQAGRSS